MKQLPWVVALLLLALLSVNLSTCGSRRARLRAAERDLATAKTQLRIALSAGRRQRARADSLERLARRDSVKRVYVVREAKVQVDTALATATAAADTVRIVLREVYPDVLDTFGRLIQGYETALAGKDKQINAQTAALADSRMRIRAWRNAADSLEVRAVSAEDALAKAEHVIAIAKRRDINLLGIRLDITCGPGAAFAVGSRGPDIGLTLGCTVGR